MINDMYNAMTIGAPEPVVGMGATITHWTDRDAATVIEWDGKIITVQQDKATRTDTNGMSDSQSYSYEPDPNGQRYSFRRNKHGRWTRVTFNPETRRWNSHDCGGLIVGFRDEHYDYSF